MFVKNNSSKIDLSIQSCCVKLSVDTSKFNICQPVLAARAVAAVVALAVLVLVVLVLVAVCHYINTESASMYCNTTTTNIHRFVVMGTITSALHKKALCQNCF